MILESTSTKKNQFVAKQSETTFEVDRKLLMVLCHIFWVLNLPKKYFNIKGVLETTLSHIIFEFYINQVLSQIQKDKYQHLYHTFLESYSI